MLNDQEIKIVQDSIPFLQEHGTALAAEFYQTMFANNPEIKKYFNMSHQLSGKQPAALAQAILAAASHIDDLSAILPAVQKISQIHCKAGIRPEHYPIVGKNLLITLKHMLGEDATDDFIKAWENAYHEIAQVFIEAEETLYQSAST